MKNILVIKHGALGDLIQTTGILKSIREHNHSHKITLLTDPKFFFFTKELPYFDDIIWSGLEFDSEKFSSLIEVPKHEGLREIHEVKEHFNRFGEFRPNELESQRIELEQRLHKEA